MALYETFKKRHQPAAGVCDEHVKGHGALRLWAAASGMPVAEIRHSDG